MEYSTAYKGPVHKKFKMLCISYVPAIQQLNKETGYHNIRNANGDRKYTFTFTLTYTYTPVTTCPLCKKSQPLLSLFTEKRPGTGQHTVRKI
jgi:hypothetical protein